MEIFDKLLSILQYDPQNPLIFTSGEFLFLFLAFVAVYSALRRAPLPRILYVTAFSLYFYYKTSGTFFLLLIYTATVDFTVGYFMGRIKRQINRRLLLAISLISNIGLLCYFKYTNFFIGLWNDVSSDPFEFQNIFLPIGISFFTFQSMSYTIDIFRRRIEPLTRWVDYLFYVSFFPQLVAGPIVRARDFIPQIRRNPISISRADFGRGVFLIATGLFKKAVISDFIALNFVDRIFDAPTLYSSFENLTAVYGYGLQIYCDFAGYSDMAIGLALLLGFHFNANFNSPYKSATITEFWRRWHISLSSWLKDYLYISLGGNRKGKIRTYVNLMLTMLIGGLWHGAALRFVVWGCLHGAALAIHKGAMSLFPRAFPTQGEDMTSRWRRILGIFLTFNFVSFAWIFFRAPDMASAWEIITQIFNPAHTGEYFGVWDVLKGYAWVFVFLGAGFALHFSSDKLERNTIKRFEALPIWVYPVVIAAVIWLVMQVRVGGVQPFIYFQF